MKHVLVAGATGLTGSSLVEQLVQSNEVSVVYVLQRKESHYTSPKIKVILINDISAEIEKLNECESVSWVYCCLGTTIKNAGSKSAFEKVDFDYVLSLGKWASRNQVAGFSLVSAKGASIKSMIHYNEVKGRIEKALMDLNFKYLHIFRPSLLLGNRIEKRPGEETARKIFSKINFILPAFLKGVKIEILAQHMIQKSGELDKTGIRIIESQYIH